MRSLRAAAWVLGLMLAGGAWALGPGDAAPDFVLADLSGQPLRLAAYRGKVVLVSFWASWCEPCLAEMPSFSRWQRSYGAAGLQILGISMDDGPAPVRRLLERHPVAYPIALGDAPLGARYGGILGLPQSFLIDRHGTVLARYKGETDLAQIEADIRTQLSAR